MLLIHATMDDTTLDSFNYLDDNLDTHFLKQLVPDLDQEERLVTRVCYKSRSSFAYWKLRSELTRACQIKMDNPSLPAAIMGAGSLSGEAFSFVSLTQ
ncbi:hypothetical protein CFP56_038505 [Quercus suber]|uniref:Uncharacterized protein n=1 Tax=Quercus suber TaxID=58331 RepID=A0AAW0J1Z5_QUESU